MSDAQKAPREDRPGTYQLCYVDPPWAYFADQPPDAVWGDDWNDAPHDCNAGRPYANRGDEANAFMVAYDADLWLVGAGDFGGYVRDRWGWLSVQQINRGEAPWLVHLKYGEPMGVDLEIPAGVTLDVFKVLVRAVGGVVYEASNQHPEPEANGTPEPDSSMAISRKAE